MLPGDSSKRYQGQFITQVRMTFSRFVPPAALAALALSATLLSANVMAQQQPSAMPTPRYQSPGIAQPQAPAPMPAINFPVTAAITPGASVAEEVIVRVNDQIISRSDVERGEDILQQEIAQNPGAGDPATRQKNMLRDLIDQQLLISKAKELGVNPDAEVVRRLDEIRKQNNLPSMEALEDAARKQGVSFEDFKANIRNSILTQSVVRDEVGRNMRMTRGEAQKYYDAHKADFAQPEQVKLSEILIPTVATADDAAVAQAQSKAEDVYKKLQGGADFAATAKAVSGGPTAASGGDLGVFRRGQLAKVLEDKTFVLPAGGYTEPVRTRQGFVILKAVDKVEAGTPPLEKIEGDVQNAMYQEQIQPALRAYLTKLREDSYLEVKPGFVDTGASPNQTKPVFASYAAPAPKKKTLDKKRLNAERDADKLAKSGLAVKNGVVQQASVQLDKHGKPKRVKREKVRFGQAPTTSLPGAATEDSGLATASNGAPIGSEAARAASASGQDVLGTAATNPALAASAGTGTAPAAAGGTNGVSADGVTAAPGTQLAPVTSNNTVAANGGDDPLAAVAAPQRKSRFSNRAPVVKVRKQNAAVAKVIDKVNSTAAPASANEKQTASVQSGALGLAGDTTKKKHKRQKGEVKERIQEKAPEQKPVLTDNGLPDRLHQQNGPQTTAGTPSASAQSGNLPADNSKQEEKERRGAEPVPAPTSDSTTLAPADRPAPGTTLPAQTPSTGGNVPPSSNTPLPQTPNQPQ